jgi:hypothetical protein
MRLLESGLELLRAEVALAAVQARQLAGRSASALIVTVVAASFAQLTLVLLVLTPVLVNIVPTGNVLVSIAVGAALTLASGLVAVNAWRSVQRKVQRKVQRATPTGAVGAEQPELQPYETVAER